MKSRDLKKIVDDDEIYSCLLKFEDALKSRNTDEAIKLSSQYMLYVDRLKIEKKYEAVDAVRHIYENIFHAHMREMER